MTTVEVKERTWERLHRLKGPGTSMDDIISGLLDEHEEVHSAHEPPTVDGDD